MKIYVFDSNSLINIRVSHSGLDHLVTDFVTLLCEFVFSRFILYFMLQRDFFSKSSKCGLEHFSSGADSEWDTDTLQMSHSVSSSRHL